jgi:alpha-tubulin suppressor-like RCC1 family protein
LRAFLWLSLALPLGCTDELVLFEPDSERDDEVPPLAGDGGADEPSMPMRDAAMDAGIDGSTPIEDAGTDAGDARLPRALAAFSQTCAIRDGDLYCWGDNRLGQCGGAADAGALAHRQAGPFVDVCAGEHHSCALRADGTTLCWGSNRAGQLGVGDDAPRMGPTAIPTLRFRAIACGGDSSCGIDPDGALYCWGDNFEGKLGTETTPSPSHSFAPKRVGMLDARQVSVGQGHTCAIDRASALYCWGRNTSMQVGVPATDAQLRTPQRVDSALTYLHVSAGQNHTCAIRSDGRLMCWGDGAPRAFEGPQPIGPRLIEEEPGYEAVYSGWFHSCAKKRGTLRCWGRNAEGQLGLGDQVYRTMPTALGGIADWEDVAVGQFHTCATRAGDLYCWGDNAFGQLDPKDRERRTAPRRLSLP